MIWCLIYICLTILVMPAKPGEQESQTKNDKTPQPNIMYTTTMNKSSDISSDRTWSLGSAEKSHWLMMQEFHHASQIALDQRAWQHEVKAEKENSSRCNNKNKGDSVAVFSFEWSLYLGVFFATQLYIFSKFCTTKLGEDSNRTSPTHFFIGASFFFSGFAEPPGAVPFYPFEWILGLLASQGLLRGFSGVTGGLNRFFFFRWKTPGFFIHDCMEKTSLKGKDAGLSHGWVWFMLNSIQQRTTGTNIFEQWFKQCFLGTK